MLHLMVARTSVTLSSAIIQNRSKELVNNSLAYTRYVVCHNGLYRMEKGCKYVYHEYVYRPYV